MYHHGISVGKNEQKLDKKISKDYLKSVFVQRRDARIKNVVKHLEINPANISFIEHHLAHLVTPTIPLQN